MRMLLILITVLNSQIALSQNVLDLNVVEKDFIANWKKFKGIRQGTIDRHWFKSCVSEVDKESKIILETKPIAGNTYLFFSLIELEDLNNPLEPKSLKFYKTKDFNGIPHYELNSEGLKKEGNLKCSWNVPFSEKHLYKMSLKDCPVENNNLFAYTELGDQIGPIEYCKVLKVSQAVKDNTGEYWLKFQIEKNDVYLDTRRMANIKNGNYIYSKTINLEKIKKEKDYRNEQNKLKLKKISQLPHFLKLKQCLLETQNSCLDKFLTKEFKISKGQDGNEMICSERNLNSEDADNCLLEHNDKILKVSKQIANEFVKLVDKSEGSLFIIEEINNIIKIQFFEDGNIFNKYKVQYELEISEKGLIFKGYFDGLAC